MSNKKYTIYSAVEIINKANDTDYMIVPFAIAKAYHKKSGYGWCTINNWRKSYCYGNGKIHIRCSRLDNKYDKTIDYAPWHGLELKCKDDNECTYIMDEYDQKAYELGAIAYMERVYTSM